jgi:hypothetical protein
VDLGSVLGREVHVRQHVGLALVDECAELRPFASELGNVSATTTETGLKVCCEIDGKLYPKGVDVFDEEIQAINITRDTFHGEWNYTIAPNQLPP